MGATKHLEIRVYGRVQGVGFRYSAEHQARRFRLTGFARNEPDGSVYIEVEGDEEALKQFLEWCGKGPWLAEVERIEAGWSDAGRDFTATFG